MPKRICIVTPDTPDSEEKGAISTHCYFLACFLSRQGYDVTVLLTASICEKKVVLWKRKYQEHYISLILIQEYNDPSYSIPVSVDMFIALKVWEVLKYTDFQQIHFQDLLAHGFYCIQAKISLGAFKNTLLTVTAHSSTEWIHEGMEQWNSKIILGTKLFWCERYCVKHCDMLISPSHYMLRWLHERDWVLPEQQQIVPSISDNTSLSKSSGFHADGVIAFFGRLETCKGLKLFCCALNTLPKKLKASIRKILFVGPQAMVDGQSSASYIDSHLGEFTGKYFLHTNLNSFEAQQLLIAEQALVCIPSLMDNLPYSVIECACRNIPLIASNVGGIPEIIPQECLFVPTTKGLADKLAISLQCNAPMPLPLYTATYACAGWSTIVDTTVLESETVIVSPQPLVSVCIAYYNHGKYLPQALEALVKQSYTNFEVIITDDGSTDVFSKKVFDEMAKSYDNRFTFFHKENSGPGDTRNYCAGKAKGEYLIFYDADNIAFPNMLQSFVNGINYSNADALTCHFFAFSEISQDGTPIILYRHMPLGADLVSGLIENVYGDTNSIIKKEVFYAVGGFTSEALGFEDWDLFTRISLRGYSFDVIPEPIFWSRQTEDGMRSDMSLYEGQRMVLASYSKTLPKHVAHAFEHLLIPLFNSRIGSNAVIIHSMLRLGIFLENKFLLLFPPDSMRRSFISAVWSTLSRLTRKKKNS